MIMRVKDRTNSRSPEPIVAVQIPRRRRNRASTQRRDHRRSSQPVLRFSPTAWAKLHFFCHRGDTEIGGFGVTRADDLLVVEEFLTVKQETSAGSVVFDDAAVADFFDAQVDAGRRPEQFARVWLHSHPGDCRIQPPDKHHRRQWAYAYIPV